MITRIREVRHARGMTLQEVADRCDPPTTPQTLGRLETGTRTVSVGWLNRIAKALDVDASELVTLPQRDDVPVAAILDAEGAHAPRHPVEAIPPRPSPDLVAVNVAAGVGDYRAGDEIWLERLAPADYAAALNRDLLVPRPAGRFIFGRLIGREDGRLHILPFGAGQRQCVVADPDWAAVAMTLIRRL
jgi:transcriptional regulator with XRE-family HTH domain